MQYTILILIAVLSVAAAMSNAFLKGLGKMKSAAAPKAADAATSAPAAAAPKKFKKDMTWGGRPDPTPELFVDETVDAGNWLNAGWRYNKKD